MSCENRQQPTWILRERDVKRWCACVCAPHFFSSLRSFTQIILIIIKFYEQITHCQQNTVLVNSRDSSTIKFFGVLLLCCARIDNNRREYWVEKLRKMVYMRVCSAFFFSLRSFIKIACHESNPPNTQMLELLTKQLGFGLVRVVYCCARIDNNRREYWEESARKMVCMCVCSEFFLFLVAQLCKLIDIIDDANNN